MATKKTRKAPSPAQLAARKKFAAMAKARAKAAKAGKRTTAKKVAAPRRRNRTVIKAKRVLVLNPKKRAAKKTRRNPSYTVEAIPKYTSTVKETVSALTRGSAVRKVRGKVEGPKNIYRYRVEKNPTRGRVANKRGHLSESDIAQLPDHVQRQIRAQLGQLEKQEAKARTPKQVKAVERKHRSLISRIGTRLRVIGQTKTFKVSARALDRAPRKTVKIRARHESDALAKAKSKLRGNYDEFKVQNGRKVATRRTTAKRTAPKRRANGPATKVRQLREEFVDTPSTKTASMFAPKGTPRNLAKLGLLVAIHMRGGRVIKPGRRNPGGAVWLCEDANKKLHLVTNGARLVDGPKFDFGEIKEIEYAAAKPHLGHPRQTVFFHKMGEEGGSKPTLQSDGEGGLKIRGGSYTITPEGIRN